MWKENHELYKSGEKKKKKNRLYLDRTLDSKMRRVFILLGEKLNTILIHSKNILYNKIQLIFNR